MVAAAIVAELDMTSSGKAMVRGTVAPGTYPCPLALRVTRESEHRCAKTIETSADAPTRWKVNVKEPSGLVTVVAMG